MIRTSASSVEPRPAAAGGGADLKPIEIPFEPETYRDADTDREVIRLFPAEQNACHAYFTSTSYDGEGRLILSVEIDGRWQLCRADLNKGTLHQLTDHPNLTPQIFCMSSAQNRVISPADNNTRLLKVDLENGDCETLLAVPENWEIELPTIDAEGRRIAFSVFERPIEVTKSDAIYATMAETFYFRPRSTIFTIDLDGGTPTAIWGDNNWISHVLINPVDPDTVVFCHEGGSLPQHRLWVVDARPLRKKQARCLYHERYEEFLVHEYFLQDGTLGVQYTVYPEDDAEVPDPRKGRSAVLFLNMDGGVAANYWLPGLRSGHVQSNSDNSLIVADRYFEGCDGHYGEGAKFMALHVPGNDAATVEKLCLHGSSWKTQLSHPHPIFSPDDKHVLFSAERDGRNGVYLVTI